MTSEKNTRKNSNSQLHPIHNLVSETAEQLAGGAWSDRWLSNNVIERKGVFDLDGSTVGFTAVITLGVVHAAA